MEWVRLVNDIRNMAEELVLKDWCRSKSWKTPSGAFGCL
ncbi:TnpV protein [Blautia sp. TF12-31AT]